MAHHHAHTDHHGKHHHAQSKIAKEMRHRHETKVGKVMHEWKHGELHSGSKHGPVVKSRQQAIAIGLSEQRKAAHGGKHHRRHK